MPAQSSLLIQQDIHHHKSQQFVPDILLQVLHLAGLADAKYPLLSALVHQKSEYMHDNMHQADMPTQFPDDMPYHAQTEYRHNADETADHTAKDFLIPLVCKALFLPVQELLLPVLLQSS